VSILAGGWIDLFRNLPLIFLILYFALGLPSSWKEAWEDAMPSWAPEAFQSGLVLGALLGLVLYNSAVLAEIMRAGILSLPRGQREAAAALGMTYRQQMRHVILPQGLRRIVLPQAFRTVISPLGSLTIAMIKNSAIIGVSLLALPDLLKQARIVQARTFQTDETFFWAAVGYLILTGAVTLLVRNLERRYAIHR
jgi:ABC-type amino acid transport system permease subunit